MLIIFDVPVDLEMRGRLCRAAETHGYGFSCIELDSEYDRDEMIEVLQDWSWSGPPDRRPSWYLERSEDENDDA